MSYTGQKGSKTASQQNSLTILQESVGRLKIYIIVALSSDKLLIPINSSAEYVFPAQDSMCCTFPARIGGTSSGLPLGFGSWRKRIENVDGAAPSHASACARLCRGFHGRRRDVLTVLAAGARNSARTASAVDGATAPRPTRLGPLARGRASLSTRQSRSLVASHCFSLSPAPPRPLSTPALALVAASPAPQAPATQIATKVPGRHRRAAARACRKMFLPCYGLQLRTSSVSSLGMPVRRHRIWPGTCAQKFFSDGYHFRATCIASSCE
jgi:hypothetical protein